MYAAKFWQIAAPFLAIAAVNSADPPAVKPPARPKATTTADNPFGNTPRRRPPNPPAEKGKQAASEPAATAAPPNPLCHLYLPLPTPAERKIEAALRSPTPPIEFSETPLKDVIDYLKGAVKIEIQLDAAGMKDAGIDADLPVTKDIRGVSLDSALDMLLDEVGLGWEIRHEVLSITTPKRLAEHHTTRLYFVADLLPAGGKGGKPQDDYSTLIDLITATVAPGSWQVNGGSGSIKGATLGGPNVLSLSAQRRLTLEPVPDLCGAQVLSVWATDQVHRDLAEYLSNIRCIHAWGAP